MAVSEHADFCIGYFNLRGWKLIDERVAAWPGGEKHQCRVLVGMEALPEETLQIAYTGVDGQDIVDNATAIRFHHQAAQSFREQLTLGIPRLRTSQLSAG